MSDKAKYGVGNMVWLASFTSHEKWVKCPHCLGFKFATVTFGDGSSASVDCGECSRGFEPPSGLQRIYVHEPKAEFFSITGVSIRREYGDKAGFIVEYSLGSCRRGTEEDVFDTEGEALIRAQKLSEEWKIEEEKRISQKDKPSRTWAQNASYHRRMITQAQSDLDYHTQKMNAAKALAKEGQIS